MGGNCEEERVPPLEIIDLKPYIFESAEDRVLSLMNTHYKEALRDPVFGTMIPYGDTHVAMVKKYCDTDPTSENFIILNLKSIAQA